MPIWNSDVHE